jgi:hypothetical protein
MEFEVHTSQRVIKFRASSAAECKAWLDAVEAACQAWKTSRHLKQKATSFCSNDVDILWSNHSGEEDARPCDDELASRARLGTQGSTPSFSPWMGTSMEVASAEDEKPSTIASSCSTLAGVSEPSLFVDGLEVAEADAAEAGQAAAFLPSFGLGPLCETSELLQPPNESEAQPALQQEQVASFGLEPICETSDLLQPANKSSAQPGSKREQVATKRAAGPVLLGHVGGKAVQKTGSLADVWANINKHRQEEVVFEAHCKGPSLDGQRRTAPRSAVRTSSPRAFLPSAPGDASWLH